MQYEAVATTTDTLPTLTTLTFFCGCEALTVMDCEAVNVAVFVSGVFLVWVIGSAAVRVTGSAAVRVRRREGEAVVVWVGDRPVGVTRGVRVGGGVGVFVGPEIVVVTLGVVVRLCVEDTLCVVDELCVSVVETLWVVELVVLVVADRELDSSLDSVPVSDVDAVAASVRETVMDGTEIDVDNDTRGDFVLVTLRVADTEEVEVAVGVVESD